MNTYLAQKQPDKAIAAANTQIEKAPDSSPFYDLLGTVLFNNKKNFCRSGKRHSKNLLNSSEQYGRVNQAGRNLSQ